MAYAAEAFDLEDLAVGQHAEFETIIADEDIDRFAALSDRVAHGAYLVALASRLVGMYLPGRNALLLSTQVSFVAPTHPGARVRVRGEIEQLSDSVRSVVLRLTIHDTAAETLLARGRLTVGFTAHG
jgi:acyl dehydratase